MDYADDKSRQENPTIASPLRDQRRIAVLKHLDAMEQFLSPQVLRLTELVADPDHDFQEVIDIVRTDAALTISILRAVNSPAYGLVETITSIERAVAYLGESFVVNAAIQGSSGERLQLELPGYRNDIGTFWDHNLRTAIASRELASLHNRKSPDNPLSLNMVYICGLLHDLGKVVISDYLQQCEPELIPVLAEAEDCLAAEENLIGVNHVMAGDFLARNWKLPPPIPTILRYHHSPHHAIDDRQPLAYAVWLGNKLANRTCCDEDVEELKASLGHAYTYQLFLPADAFDKALWRMEQEYQRISKSMAR